MKIETRNRKYQVGLGAVKIDITDSGSILLAPDEQVTFTTERGGQYDVTRKSWGFFATPSLNGRLPKFNLRPVLIKARERYFVLLVERGCEEGFDKYVRDHGYLIALWLDEDLCGRMIEF